MSEINLNGGSKKIILNGTTYYAGGSNSSGGSTLITKSITENGTYSAQDDNADGFSKVSVNVVEHPTKKRLVNNWNFKESLTDSIGGITATLYRGASRDDVNGLVIPNNNNQYVYLNDTNNPIDITNKTIEIKFGNYNDSYTSVIMRNVLALCSTFNSSTNARHLLGFHDYRGFCLSGLTINGNNASQPTSYNYSIDKNIIANKTVDIEIDNWGRCSLFVDGIKISKIISSYVNTDYHFLALGRISDSAASCSIESIKIYDNAPDYLYKWDFTKSLVDEVSSQTAILMNATQTTNGIEFDAQQEGLILNSNIDMRGKTIEIDVASMDAQSDSFRFIVNSQSSNNISPLAYDTTNGWHAYGYDSNGNLTNSESYGNIAKNYFNGKTIKIIYGVEKGSSLYVNDEFIGSESEIVWSSTYNTLGISQTYSAAIGIYNTIISGIRIYENE